MDLALIFTLCNSAVMPFWLLLVVAPSWSWTQRLVHSALIPVLLGSVYVAGFLTSPPAPPGASFGSLEGVTLFFSSPHGVLVGWVHYLVFDLFVGAWESRDAMRRGIHPAAVAPCLVLTLMLGPAGLLAYLGLRAALRRTGTLVESNATAG
jgi:hypothetical protein